MTSVDVAIACCRASGDADPHNLYPDPDAPPLIDALADLGASSAAVSWDDPSIEWSSFRCVVISSTWDSVDRPDAYLGWVDEVATKTVVTNAAPIVRWAIDKAYLVDLATCGLPVIPTQWLAPGAHFDWPAGEFVIKPSISAGGRSTARYDALRAGEAMDHVLKLHSSGQTVMVQPYLQSVDIDGEMDLIYIGGTFSHAVRKHATLRLGEGEVERPWERMAWDGLVSPSPEQLRIGAEAIAVVSERFDEPLTYGRVDLVAGSSGDPLVLEVELIDPYLSLDLLSEASTRLAAAILRGL